MIHGTVHGIAPDLFPWGMEWKRNGMEWSSIQDQVDNLTVGGRAARDWTWF